MIRNVLKPDKKEFLLLLLQNRAEPVWSVRKLGDCEFLKGFTQACGSSKILLGKKKKSIISATTGLAFAKLKARDRTYH